MSWIYVTEQAPPPLLPGTTATDPKCFEKANLCEMARVHDNTTLVRFGKAPWACFRTRCNPHVKRSPVAKI